MSLRDRIPRSEEVYELFVWPTFEPTEVTDDVFCRWRFKPEAIEVIRYINWLCGSRGVMPPDVRVGLNLLMGLTMSTPVSVDTEKEWICRLRTLSAPAAELTVMATGTRPDGLPDAKVSYSGVDLWVASASLEKIPQLA